MSKDNVLVFGLGGIGGVYACTLQLSGKCNVHVVARSTYDSVKNHGLKLASPVLGNHESIKFAGVWKTCKEAADAGVKFAYVVVATKALFDAVPSLSDNIAPLISPSTSVVILQNGVGNETHLHKSFPNSTIISACVWTGGRTLPTEPTSGISGVEQFNALSLTIGVDYRSKDESTRKDEEAKLDTFVEWIRAAKGECKVTKDIQSERWEKVTWNACVNGLTAAAKVRSGVLLESTPRSTKVAKGILHEVSTVAAKKGLKLPPNIIEELYEKMRTGMGALGFPSSMMMDSIAGRPMEVEAILGAPMRDGEELGVPMPYLTSVYTILKAIDHGNKNPDQKPDGP